MTNMTRLQRKYNKRSKHGVVGGERYDQMRNDALLAVYPRCSCEYDDLFDMCLNCITHRQLTFKIQ
jgi:hypothetical protein